MSQRISHQPRIATMQPEQPHDCQKSVEQIKYLLNELNYLKNQVEWLRDEVRNLEKKVERKDEKALANPGNWWEKRDIK